MVVQELFPGEIVGVCWRLTRENALVFFIDEVYYHLEGRVNKQIMFYVFC